MAQSKDVRAEMGSTQAAKQSRPDARRAPNPHSDAVQEAKRLEKLQSHGSSRRTAGAGRAGTAEGEAG